LAKCCRVDVCQRESFQIDRFQVRLNDYGDNQFEISRQAIKTPIEPKDVQIRAKYRLNIAL